jgi:hypothetical protein
MKIRLMCRLPVEERHGMTEGRVLDVVREEGLGRNGYYWVIGDAGERLKVFRREASIVKEDPAES